MRLPWLRRNERGAAAALTTIALSFVLVPMAALVVDVGTLYVEREELQSGADAAAIRIAQACLAGECDDPADLADQLALAEQYADVNAKDNATEVTEVCGTWVGLPECTPHPTESLGNCIGTATGEYVEVRVRTETKDGSTLLPPTFAQSISGNSGYNGTTVTACGRATADDATSTTPPPPPSPSPTVPTPEPTTPPTTPPTSGPCVDADDATYTHTFNGPAGTATITADKTLCAGEEQDFALVSYTAQAPTWSGSTPQYIYDAEVKTITSATKSVSLDVDVPACYNQVDFVFDATLYNPLTEAVYHSRKVGESGAPGNRSKGSKAWYNGGRKKCDPKPSVTVVNKCSGAMQVKLTNGSSANIDASFYITAGASSQTVRVGKGKTTTVTIPKKDCSTVGVLDSAGYNNSRSWKKKGCQ